MVCWKGEKREVKGEDAPFLKVFVRTVKPQRMVHDDWRRG